MTTALPATPDPAATPAAPALDLSFRLGDISATHDAAVHIATIVVVCFILSLVLKRVFARLGRRMGLAHIVAATAFHAVSRFTHLLIFAFTLKAIVSANGLSFGDFQRVVAASSGVLVIVAITVALLRLVSVPVAAFKLFADKTESKLDDILVPIISTSLRLLVILGGVIEVIHYLSGTTPTQIVAALGVGGLAIGLAAQDTIKNFFGSIMLIVDKPFTLGDFINIGTHAGTVESLGLRSTRIRTVDGHLVTVPNGDLANRAIQNVTERKSIRNLTTLTLAYETPPATLEALVARLRAHLENHEGHDPAFPPRVHIEQLAAYAVNVQVIYWYFPADYWKYMDFNQRLQLDLLRLVADSGAALAYPTQTLDIRTATKA